MEKGKKKLESIFDGKGLADSVLGKSSSVKPVTRKFTPNLAKSKSLAGASTSVLNPKLRAARSAGGKSNETLLDVVLKSEAAEQRRLERIAARQKDRGEKKNSFASGSSEAVNAGPFALGPSMESIRRKAQRGFGGLGGGGGFAGRGGKSAGAAALAARRLSNINDEDSSMENVPSLAHALLDESDASGAPVFIASSAHKGDSDNEESSSSAGAGVSASSLSSHFTTTPNTSRCPSPVNGDETLGGADVYGIPVRQQSPIEGEDGLEDLDVEVTAADSLVEHFMKSSVKSEDASVDMDDNVVVAPENPAILFFQFPPHLPFLTTTQDKKKSDSPLNDNNNDNEDDGGDNDEDEGLIGEICIYEDGESVLEVNAGNGKEPIRLDLSLGTDVNFLQVLVSIDKQDKAAYILGAVADRFILSPSIDIP